MTMVIIVPPYIYIYIRPEYYMVLIILINRTISSPTIICMMPVTGNRIGFVLKFVVQRSYCGAVCVWCLCSNSCLAISLRIYVSVCLFIFVCFVYICVCMCVLERVCVYVCARMCLNVWERERAMCMCMCVFVYICSSAIISAENTFCWGESVCFGVYMCMWARDKEE